MKDQIFLKKKNGTCMKITRIITYEKYVV